ncbi:unnamed protein product [Penicillium camemberti]|uniref:Str. FM013 n=1 Tax=Penicillium camemberti (strain FM 013) TaxID=1429867 RepID=A0A0G4PHN4_PENC3|nr:unnamed protein product [Penicillium camemberti]
MEHKHSPPSKSFKKDAISERMGRKTSRMTSLCARGEPRWIDALGADRVI